MLLPSRDHPLPLAAMFSPLAAAAASAPPDPTRPSDPESGPAPLQRPGPDTEGGDPTVQLHATRHPDEMPVEGPIRTRDPLDVCVVCGHERVHTPRQETSCPECGGTARRSFALFQSIREEHR